MNFEGLILNASGGVFPPKPTREQVCGITCRSMNSCPDVVTKQWGKIPWFEPILGTLVDPQDRANVYAVKHGMGDTHAIIGMSSVAGVMYDEPCDIQHVYEPNQELQLPWFRALIEEIIRNRFVPVIALDGDNGDNVPRGSANALRQLPILINLLQSSHYRDLREDVLIARFWDGVFYGTSRENALKFGQEFRRLNPNGHLAIEHQPGRIPFGEGTDDWMPGAAMSFYDVPCHEFDYANDVPPNPTIWQVGGRMLGAAYVIGPDQDGDFHPPNYQLHGTPRGPWINCALEWEGTYWAVRRGTAPGHSTLALEQQRRDYLLARGWKYTG